LALRVHVFHDYKALARSSSFRVQVSTTCIARPHALATAGPSRNTTPCRMTGVTSHSHVRHPCGGPLFSSVKPYSHTMSMCVSSARAEPFFQRLCAPDQGAEPRAPPHALRALVLYSGAQGPRHLRLSERSMQRFADMTGTNLWTRRY